MSKHPVPTGDKFLALSCTNVGVGHGGTTSMLAYVLFLSSPTQPHSPIPSRVAIVNYHGEIVVDTFVAPTMPITDCRSSTWHRNNFGQFQFGYLPTILPLPSTHFCPQRFNSTSSNSVSLKFLKIKSSSATASGTISQVLGLITGCSLSNLFISSPRYSTSRGQHQRCRPVRSVP